MSARPASIRTLVLIGALALVPGALPSLAAQQPPPAKQVAAPPDEIRAGHLALPDPAASAVRSRGAWLPVEPGDWGADGRLRLELPAEGGQLELLAVFPDPGRVGLRLAEPGGALRALDAWRAEGRAVSTIGALSSAAPGVPGTLHRVVRDDRAPGGPWTVELRDLAPERGPAPRGALLVGAVTGPELVTQLAHWELTDRARPALLARLVAPGADATLTSPAWSAVLHARDAHGGELRATFHDDGRHADGAPGDGVFGAWLPTEVPGVLSLRVEAAGTTADGAAFLRTAQLAVPLHHDRVDLVDDVRLRRIDPLRVQLLLPVEQAPDDARRHVSAELWGHDAAGAPTPVAWLSTITDGRAGALGARGGLPLQLDLRWVSRAAALPPFELRAVRVQHPDSHALLTTAARLAVPTLPAAPPAPAAVDAAMLTGLDHVRLRVLEGPGAPPAPSSAAAGPVPQPGAGPTAPRAPVATSPDQLPSPEPDPVRALMLVHGYCSSLVWDPGDFSGERIVFMDPGANRSHDAFAQLIAAAGSAVDSFGVVAHSQGGAAALHLLTYYASGLDLAEGPRRIQSVGTPYQGTPLGGDLAALGEIFGAGCGTNTDLSVDGAALWLAGIPMWARAEVHHYTTSTGGFWCDFVTNFVLSNPEDGVVERFRGQLPGGFDEGHVTGWCHTTGMNDPAQYFDTARNAEMDALAAR